MTPYISEDECTAEDREGPSTVKNFKHRWDIHFDGSSLQNYINDLIVIFQFAHHLQLSDKEVEGGGRVHIHPL